MRPRRTFRDVPERRRNHLLCRWVKRDDSSIPVFNRTPARSSRRLCIIAFACVAVIGVQRAVAQIGDVPQEGLRTDRTDLPTPINQPPDLNARMQARAHGETLRNFDRANALRIQQIQDETNKLLILARDLKAQMERIGEKPLPPILLRETEVIRILAHDVQAKMTLTVRAD